MPRRHALLASTALALGTVGTCGPLAAQTVLYEFTGDSPRDLFGGAERPPKALVGKEIQNCFRHNTNTNCQPVTQQLPKLSRRTAIALSLPESGILVRPPSSGRRNRVLTLTSAASPAAVICTPRRIAASVS